MAPDASPLIVRRSYIVITPTPGAARARPPPHGSSTPRHPTPSGRPPPGSSAGGSFSRVVERVLDHRRHDQSRLGRLAQCVPRIVSRSSSPSPATADRNCRNASCSQRAPHRRFPARARGGRPAPRERRPTEARHARTRSRDTSDSFPPTCPVIPATVRSPPAGALHHSECGTDRRFASSECSPSPSKPSSSK